MIFTSASGLFGTADGDVGNQRKVCFLCKRNPYVKTESTSIEVEKLTPQHEALVLDVPRTTVQRRSFLIRVTSLRTPHRGDPAVIEELVI